MLPFSKLAETPGFEDVSIECSRIRPGAKVMRSPAKPASLETRDFRLAKPQAQSTPLEA
jgi:hypothetical protein